MRDITSYIDAQLSKKSQENRLENLQDIHQFAPSDTTAAFQLWIYLVDHWLLTHE